MTHAWRCFPLSLSRNRNRRRPRTMRISPRSWQSSCQVNISTFSAVSSLRIRSTRWPMMRTNQCRRSVAWSWINCVRSNSCNCKPSLAFFSSRIKSTSALRWSSIDECLHGRSQSIIDKLRQQSNRIPPPQLLAESIKVRLRWWRKSVWEVRYRRRNNHWTKSPLRWLWSASWAKSIINSRAFVTNATWQLWAAYRLSYRKTWAQPAWWRKSTTNFPNSARKSTV